MDQTTVTGSALVVALDPTNLAYTLTVVHHPDPGQLGARCVIDDGAELVLGRKGGELGPGVLEDNRLSRRHCKLVREGDRVHVRDLESRNGTQINGQSIVTGELVAGDILAVGSQLMLLHLAPEVFETPRHRALLGCGHGIASVLEQVRQVASRPTTVLLHGETGVGKEVVARTLHELSGRRGPLVAINCGSVQDSLLGSELFGHAKGAFSGADTTRRGLVAEAAGGTLFLDEIGDASPALQVGLLRLLQEKTYRPVGSNQSRPADVRIVAATHRDLTSESFREDLRMRLTRWVIEVPPLRQRIEDVPILAHHFANRYCPSPIRLDRPFVHALLAHPWPGNVRELDAVIERAVVSQTTRDGILRTPTWLPKMLAANRADGAAEDTIPPARPKNPGPEALASVLEACRGQVKAAAARLGVTRKTAYRWFQAAGIDPDDFR